MQSVTRPRVRPSRRIEWISLVVSTAPVAPIGWPCATAPPSTLTTSSGSPSSRATTMAMAAKASLISARSMDRFHLVGAKLRARDRGADRHGTEIGRRYLFQSAAEGTDCSTNRLDKDD